MIHFKDLTSFLGLKSTLFQQYGEGVKPNQFLEKYYWFSPKIIISLDYSEILEKGTISFFYKPILDQQQIDKSEAAKQGANDL